MKLKPDANITHFLQAVHDCRGGVHFTTPEGDDLNLKSNLSQLVFAAVIAEQLQKLDGDIIVEDDEDFELLEQYLS